MPAAGREVGRGRVGSMLPATRPLRAESGVRLAKDDAR